MEQNPPGSGQQQQQQQQQPQQQQRPQPTYDTNVGGHYGMFPSILPGSSRAVRKERLFSHWLHLTNRMEFVR